MKRAYNNAMVRHPSKYYEGSGYFNFGYWGGQARSQREACDALVDRLTGEIALKGGRILDVACGAGASTRRLMDSYPPEMISAINISEQQLAEAQERAPGCTFLRMDAARLEFPDNHFDAVMSIEAAFHFDTRDAFLREAFRVLKPGGSLVLSDILFRPFAAPLVDFIHVPRANLWPGLEHYSRVLKTIGFDAIRVEDATGVCLRPFCRNLMRWPISEFRAGRAGFRKSVQRLIGHGAVASYFGATCKTYMLVAGRKPVGAGLG
jgi:MPBQ/MSBQ methyltransferase